MPPPPVRGGANPRTKSDPALAIPGNQVHIIAMERLTPSFEGTAVRFAAPKRSSPAENRRNWERPFCETGVGSFVQNL